MTLKEFSFDASWSLFLDRDGVINKRIIDGYVTHPDEFVFLPGVPRAVQILSGLFGRVFVVTNQQGIGKALMTEKDLQSVHDKMIRELENQGAQINAVYFSPYLEQDKHISRKPDSGMALKAKEEFPELDFTKSVMVGDTENDIEFGKRLGMITVFIGHKEQFDNFEPDFIFESLLAFATNIEA